MFRHSRVIFKGAHFHYLDKVHKNNEYELPEDDTIVSKHVGAW